MEGPSLDVSSASLDIFMMAPALSGSLVPAGRWWVTSSGQAGELDLTLVQNWGTSLICMQSGSEQLAGLLPLFLYFLLSFTPALPPPALSAVVSALLFRPPVPVPFASQRAASCLFLLQVSAALGVPASSPPWLLFWGCCAQGWLAGPHLSGALYQAKFW